MYIKIQGIYSVKLHVHVQCMNEFFIHIYMYNCRACVCTCMNISTCICVFIFFNFHMSHFLKHTNMYENVMWRGPIEVQECALHICLCKFTLSTVQAYMYMYKLNDV